MDCPNCGGPLEERYARVPMPLPFASAEAREEKRRWTQKRIVYVCGGCGKTWIRTLTLVETEILGY